MVRRYCLAVVASVGLVWASAGDVTTPVVAAVDHAITVDVGSGGAFGIFETAALVASLAGLP